MRLGIIVFAFVLGIAIIYESTYRQISYISRTESQNLNASRLALQLSLCNLLNLGVNSNMKM